MFFPLFLHSNLIPGSAVKSPFDEHLIFGASVPVRKTTGNESSIEVRVSTRMVQRVGFKRLKRCLIVVK